MLSTLLELLGFAALAAATYLLAGLAGALIVGGAELLLVGYAIEDEQATVALAKAARAARGRAGALSARAPWRRRDPVAPEA